MSSFNDITGQQMKTKASTDAYRDGWDTIFGKKKEPVKISLDGIETVTPEMRKQMEEAARQPDHRQQEALPVAKDEQE